VGLIAGGWLGGEEAERQLWELVHGPSPEARQALALAFHLLPPDRFAELADELIGSDEPGLVTLMTRSLAAQPSLAYIDTLIQSLAERDARAEARQALIKLGRPALARLEQALWDDEQPRRVRRHLPRTISRFEPHRATMILIRRLRVEPDPAVSFKILRGLGRLRASAPWTPIDRDLLFDLLQRMLERSTALLHWGQLIERAHARGARPRLRSAELLIAALLDLEQHAAERAFRLLHIIEPTEEFWMIYDGLRSADAKVRASSRELLSMVVPEPMRQGIIALVDDAPPLERLAGAATFLEPVRRTRVTELLALLERDPGEVREQFDAHYKEALRAMLVDESRMLREVVRDYARDLGLTELGGNLVPTPAERRRFWRSHLRPEVTGAS
jgi:predicted component of type VI protein secretion system